MSHLTNEVRKKIRLVQSCCYNIDKMARQEHNETLDTSNPTTDGNVTRLDQLGNIGWLAKRVQSRCEEMLICLEIAEDMEKEKKNGERGEHEGQVVSIQQAGEG